MELLEYCANGLLWRTVVCLLSSVALCTAQKPESQQWQKLLDQEKTAEARTLCIAWQKSDGLALRVEACKCLANVALSGKQILELNGNEAGGGVLRGGYPPEAIDEALSFLNQGLALAPQDLSLHLGRLHVLRIASRYDEMAAALDESCRTYTTNRNAAVWITYTAQLFQEGQYSASLRLLRVLEKHFPDSHDVIGNIGAVWMALKKDEEAVTYLRRAVVLAPDDAIDAWNLGRLLEFTGKTAEADSWYQKALGLRWEDQDSLKSSRCLYANFVEQKLKDRRRACELQKKNCAADAQKACAAKR